MTSYYFTTLFTTFLYNVPWIVLGVYLLKKSKTSGVLLLLYAILNVIMTLSQSYFIFYQNQNQSFSMDIFGFYQMGFQVLYFFIYFLLLTSFILLIRDLNKLQKEQAKEDTIDQIGQL